MKRFFRYDYNYKVFVIENIVSLLLLAIFIATYHYDWDKLGVWLIGVGFLINIIVTFALIKNQGIRIKNNNVTIVDYFSSLFGRRFKLTQVNYVELKELKKEKRSNLYGFFHEFYHPDTYMFHCDYVYNHGRVFEIVFYLKDGSRRETYFGWLYREKNEKTVARVCKSLESFISEINEHVKVQRNNQGK